MIQCERCNVWQHNTCMGITTNEAEAEKLAYFCDVCEPEDHADPLAADEAIELDRDGLEDQIWDLVNEQPIDRFWPMYNEILAEKTKSTNDGEIEETSDGYVEKEQEDEETSLTPDSGFGSDSPKLDDMAKTTEANANAAQVALQTTENDRYQFNTSIDNALQAIFLASSLEKLRSLRDSLRAVKGNPRNVRNHLHDRVNELVDEGGLEETKLGKLKEVFQWEKRSDA